jgi:hypothetical protein
VINKTEKEKGVEIWDFSIILCVWNSVFCSVSTIRNMNTPRMRLFNNTFQLIEPTSGTWLVYIPFYFYYGVRLSPLGTAATVWSIAPVPDDWWWWLWSSWWNENLEGKPRCSEETCRSATLSTTNLTGPDLGLNPAPRGGKPGTNRLSYGRVDFFTYTCIALLVFYSSQGSHTGTLGF